MFWILDCYVASDSEFPVNTYHYALKDCDAIYKIYLDIKNLFCNRNSVIVMVKVSIPLNNKQYTFYSLQEAEEKIKLWLTFS